MNLTYIKKVFEIAMQNLNTFFSFSFLFFFIVNKLKKDWKQIRDGYTRCKKERTKRTKSGSKGGRLPTCNYYELLGFLSDPTDELLSQATSNLPDDQMSLATSLESEIETLTETAPILSGSITTPSSTDPRKPFISRKRSHPSSRESNEVDKLFISTLQDVNNQIKEVNQEAKQDDSNSYFCKSLITTMEELTPEQNMLARIKIQQVLFEIKFNKNI